MKGVVLAAGEGTRLRPLTLDRPKPMVEVAGKPVIGHIIHWLRLWGIREIAVNLHYRPQAITGYLADGAQFGVHVTYSFENPILGSAGALKKLEHFFDQTFIVAYGDVLTDASLGRLLAFHRSRRAAVTALLYRVANPTQCGIADLDAEGRLRRLVEKPRLEEVFGDLANAGVLVMERQIIATVPERRFYDIGADLLPDLIARGLAVYGLPIEDGDTVIDIGSQERYALACREWPAIAERMAAQSC